MKVKLGDICSKGSSGIKLKELAGFEGEYPIYGASGKVGNVNFFHQSKPYVAVVKDGAGIGRTMLLPAQSSVIGTLQYLIPAENVLASYLYYAVKNLHLERGFSGSTIPHIYFRDYKHETVQLRPLREQEHIISVLGRLEAIINKRQQQLDNLDLVIKSQFIELTSSDCVTLKTLSDLGSIATGSTPPVANTEYYETKDIPFIKPGDMTLDSVLEVAVPENYISNAARSVARIFAPNSVYVTCIGATIGKVCVSKRECSCNQQINVITPNANMSAIYVAYAIFHARAQILQSANTTALPILNKGQFMKLKIPVVSTKTQNRFAEFVQQVDKSKFAAHLFPREKMAGREKPGHLHSSCRAGW